MLTTIKNNVNIYLRLIQRGETMFNEILTAITTVGFPIVACGALAWYVKFLTEAHKKESDDLRKSLDANTSVMRKLLDKLEREVNNGK